jgi:hypothetical protein
MTGDFSTGKASFRDDEDIDTTSPTDLRKLWGAPTTQKRVARSTRHPPGPSVNDGPGESAVSTEETPEDLGTGLIESVQNVLKTRKGLDDLKEGLDGRSAEERSAAELERLERTLAQLRKEGTLESRVFAIRRPGTSRLRFPDGSTREASLGPRQRSVWLGHSGHRAIVVAVDLPEDIRVEEILSRLADEIETVAAENRVSVVPDGTLTVLHRMIGKPMYHIGLP